MRGDISAADVTKWAKVVRELLTNRPKTNSHHRIADHTMGCCPKDERAGEVYIPRKDRVCTDVFCLMAIVLTWGGMGTLSYVCIHVKPELLYDLYYPTDSYGQHCGRPGTATERLPVVMYPQLDRDIQENYDLIVKHQWVTFFNQVSKLCASRCPAQTSLATPQQYGGPTYPREQWTDVHGYENVSASLLAVHVPTPTYQYTFHTVKYAWRCFPTTSTYAGGYTDLCVDPPCDMAYHELAGEQGSGAGAADVDGMGNPIECATLPARPDETTTWEICPEGISDIACVWRRGICRYSVQEASAWWYLPEAQTPNNVEYTEEIASYARNVIGGFDGLIFASTEILCFGFGMPLLACFAWLLLLWLAAGTIVWLMMIFLVVCCVLIAIFLCVKAGWLDENVIHADSRPNFSDTGDVQHGDSWNSGTLLDSTANEELQIWYEVGAIASLLLTIMVIMCLCLWAKCINRTIAIIRECVKVFHTLPVMVVWPLGGLAISCGLLIWAIVMFFWIWDDEVWVLVYEEYGNIGGGDGKISQEEQIVLSVFTLLAALWSLNFVRAISWSAMASAVGYWFIVDNAPRARPNRSCCCWGGTGCGFVRLIDSTWTIVSRHLGSMAFGSLIVATIQLLRIVLKAVEASTKDAQRRNLIIKLVLKCAQCAMWCLQGTVEYISYYGYVYVALEGGGFCKGCRSTFELIARFPAQAAVNKTVQKLLNLLMAWSVPTLSAASCWYYLEGYDEYIKEGYSAAHATLAVFLMAWVIADGMTTVLSCCIDTVYLSAFVDMDANDPPKCRGHTSRSSPAPSPRRPCLSTPPSRLTSPPSPAHPRTTHPPRLLRASQIHVVRAARRLRNRRCRKRGPRRCCDALCARLQGDARRGRREPGGADRIRRRAVAHPAQPTQPARHAGGGHRTA